MGGALDFLASLLGGGHGYKKRKQFQTVELRVRMDCEGCELKVRNALSTMKGVRSVDINRKQYKVTVTGYVEPHKVVKRVQSTGKKAEIWPYVPYNVVARPYAAQTYDKKAPAGYVRNVEAIRVSSQVVKPEEQLAALFSDDNPNACSIM
ncbi:Heavy-metal-associated domain [Musa troglodytarum]|uniref:Heavy-metal-associated domain n=1 Tax=Musa troglodytarum TaxID=320322 RepID=A0A9E7JT90_9LILI|nr:Heavy-metal-associated domain [Musa troglodytarum]